MVVMIILSLIDISCKKFLMPGKGTRDGIARGKYIPDF